MACLLLHPSLPAPSLPLPEAAGRVCLGDVVRRDRPSQQDTAGRKGGQEVRRENHQPWALGVSPRQRILPGGSRPAPVLSRNPSPVSSLPSTRTPDFQLCRPMSRSLTPSLSASAPQLFSLPFPGTLGGLGVSPPVKTRKRVTERLPRSGSRLGPLIREHEGTSHTTTERVSKRGDGAQWLYLSLKEEPVSGHRGSAVPGPGWASSPVSLGQRQRLRLVRERAALCQHTGRSRHGNRCPGSVLEQRGTGLRQGPLGSREPAPGQPQGRSPHSWARGRKVPPEGQTRILNRRAALRIGGGSAGPTPTVRGPRKHPEDAPQLS